MTQITIEVPERESDTSEKNVLKQKIIFNKSPKHEYCHVNFLKRKYMTMWRLWGRQRS